MILSTPSFAQNMLNGGVDATNKYIASEWRLFNRNVDTFFSNQPYLVDENKSSLLVYSSFYLKEGDSLQSIYDLEAKFDLPRTTKKLKLVIEKEKDEILNATTDESVARNKKITSKYTTGLRYHLSQSKFFTSLIHFSLRIEMPLNPAIKLNLHKNIETESINIGLFQKLILHRQEGFQEISQVSFYRKWNEIFQLDFLNSLVWTDKSDIFVLRNNLILYQHVGNERALTYSVGANAKLSPTFHYDGYDASISYRQLLYNKWLYGTFTLGTEFLKTNNFNEEKFVQLRVEVFFR